MDDLTIVPGRDSIPLHNKILGNFSAWPMPNGMGDEVRGSPTRDGVKSRKLTNGGSKIERSADASQGRHGPVNSP